jgi:hypothetical protein
VNRVYGPMDNGRGSVHDFTMGQQHGGGAASPELGRAAGSRSGGLSRVNGKEEGGVRMPKNFE